MRMSAKRQQELYNAIHSTITDIRIKLQLRPYEDIKLAQVESEIWRKQREVLGIP